MARVLQLVMYVSRDWLLEYEVPPTVGIGCSWWYGDPWYFVSGYAMLAMVVKSSCRPDVIRSMWLVGGDAGVLLQHAARMLAKGAWGGHSCV